LEARPVRLVEEAIAGEAARPRVDMNVTTPLVDLRISAREGAKTLAKPSVEEDRQGMVASALPSTPKTAANESRRCP
jgi:hypothetical protein